MSNNYRRKNKKVRKHQRSKDGLTKAQRTAVATATMTEVAPSDLPTRDAATDEKSIAELIYMCIRDIYSKEMADAFINNPEIKGWEKYTNEVQRALANRVLTSKLLIFRAGSNVKVVDAIFSLIPDGADSDWMNIFKTVILPFFKINEIKL